MVSSVRLLTAGHCKQIERFVLPKSGRWKSIQFPSSVAVIEHPRAGILLFDTGYSPRFHEATRHFPEKLYALATPVHVNPEETALAQLNKMGVQEKDVTTVILSHLHADHVAGASDFTRSRFVLGAEGWKAFRSLGRWGAVRHAFLGALFPQDLEQRSRLLSAPDYQVPIPELSGPLGTVSGFDLVGDESVLAVALPGHCPGHLGLYVRVQSGQPLFLLGDAAWSLKSVEYNEAPSAITHLLHDDAEIYRQTLHQLHEIHQRGQTRLIPCHCHSALEAYQGDAE